MEHLTIDANRAAFHVARTGAGPPLLLLHGWPEFWLTWEPVMARLADRFTLLAPDLRGFGDSDKPEGPFGPDQHAADMLALLDALGLRQVGIVGHDVGGALMQPLARKTPERFCGLFFFEFLYPGIGARMVDECVHVPPEQIVRTAIAQQPHAGGIAESALPFQVNAVNRLSGGIQQQPNLLAAALEVCFGPFPFRNVANEGGEGPLLPVLRG